MSWDIVFWANKETVDYVPSIWALSGGTSYKWPTGVPVNLKQKLIETCDSLDHVKFRICKGTAKMKAIMSLAEAQKYCERAAYTSSLETTDSETISQCGRAVEDDQSSVDNDDVPLTQITGFTPPIREYNKRPNTLSGTDTPPPDISHGSSAKKKRLINTTCSPSSDLLSQERSSPMHVYTSSPRSAVGIEERSTSLRTEMPMTDAEKFIYKGIVGLQWEIGDMRKQLNKRLSQLEELQLTGPAVYGANNESSWQLPLQDDESLESTELILNDQEKFNIFVECIYLCGGDTYHKAVYACINKLFSNELSIRYSGEGKKGKLSFQNLKCYDGVLRAVRKRFKNVTDKEVNRSISAYLAGAKDRKGGRRSREKN